VTPEQRFVRPTLACLGVLNVKLPNLDQPLHQLDHPLIVKAQKIPELIGCNEAEPILALKDRRWLKVKVGDYRGGVTEQRTPPKFADVSAGSSFWLGLAGKRQGDSKQRDFYENLDDDTAPFLPQDKDWKRWYAEQAVSAQLIARQMVRRCAWLSLTLGKPFCFEIGEALVWARIRMLDDGEVYVAIGAHGIVDAKTYAMLISSFPEIEPDEWGSEPNGVAELETEPGEIIYSALLSPQGQAVLLSEADDGEWAETISV
jgi:hypothetical protein